VPTNIVNETLTMVAERQWRVRCASGMGARMPTNSTRAGGCFLTICIIAGFFFGLAIRNPMKGVLVGTAAGAALAVLLWLIDRRRER
jgi:glutamine amidotransferase-like uncharacterized protein